MLTNKPITQLVFLDIETAPLYESFNDLPPKLKQLFVQTWQWKIDEVAFRNRLSIPEQDSYKLAYDEVYKERGALSPEFAKIICVSAGMIMEDNSFKCASFCGDEKSILTQFIANPKSFINQSISEANGEKGKYIVCYNGTSFDIPFLAKRFLYNGLNLPPILDIGGVKPWDLTFIVDLKTQIKFGGMDAPSLELLCATLGIETAQDKYGEPEKMIKAFKDGQYDFVKNYCEQDIFALAQCYLKLMRSKEYPTGNNNKLNKG